MVRYIDDRVIDNPDYALPIIDEIPDKLDREQLVSYAMSIFFITPEGKYIAMHQTKDSRVVGDNIVGIGGKIRIKTYLGEGEKIPSEIIVSSLLSVRLSADDEAMAASREVFEETTEYDENGIIIKEGIRLNPKRLKPIGTSDIRLCNENNNDAWYISYYVYNLTGEEGIIGKEGLKEGTLEEYTYEELMQQPMLPADRIILQNSNPNVHVEAIYDDIEDVHKLRVVRLGKKTLVKIMVPDYKTPFYLGKEYDIKNLLGDARRKFVWIESGENSLQNAPYIELTPFYTQKNKRYGKHTV